MKRVSLLAACLLLGVAAGAFVGRPFLQGQAPPTAPAVPPDLTSYRDIVKKILPAVVSIESHGKAPRARRPRIGSPFAEQQLPPEFRRFFEGLPRGEDEADEGPNRLGFGSGVLVDAKGVILTNYHVVEGADEVEVRLADGRKFVSHDVKVDPKTDLAIVRITAPGALPVLALGDSSAMEIGDRVLAVGAPFGLTGTVTHGIVSGKSRALNMNMYEDFLQTDAAINPGNSGGPLVNLAGQVIGINAAIKSHSGGFQGVGMAVSSNLARKIMGQLLKEGVVHRGYLGVQVRDVEDAELARRLGVPSGRGVLVVRVYDDTPGARAGLKDGDVLTAVAGKPVHDSRELQTVVAGLPVGQKADLDVVRDGKEMRLPATIEEQPRQFGSRRSPRPRSRQREQEPDAVSVERIGVEAVDLTGAPARRLGFAEGAKGALIVRVERDGLAAQAGLRRGMAITEVDRQPVASAEQLRERVGKASLEKGVLLQVRSPEGGTNYVLLKATAERAKR